MSPSASSRPAVGQRLLPSRARLKEPAAADDQPCRKDQGMAPHHDQGLEHLEEFAAIANGLC